MTSTYSRDNLAALPTDDDDLTTAFAVPADYNAVASNDGTTVDQSGTEGYALFEWKETATGNSGTFTWKGESTKAPSESKVQIQIYKRTGTGAPVWEDVSGASDNSTAADTNFTITGTVPDLTNYKADITDEVALRTWQAASGGTEITGLVQEGTTGWSNAWSATEQTGDSSWSSTDIHNMNWRINLYAASVTQSGTTIRLGFKKTTSDYTLNSAYIGVETGSNTSIYTGAPTAVFTSNMTITSAGDDIQYTSGVAFNITASDDHLCSFHIDNASTVSPYLDGTPTQALDNTAVDQSSEITWVGLSPTYSSDQSLACLAAVDVQVLSYPNTYKADLTGTVTSVEETDTETTLTAISYQGSLAATLAAVEADAGSYYHDSGANKIYIHASSGAATSHTYEWS